MCLVWFETAFTSSKSFNICFAILLTFHTSWPTIPIAHATPTYSSNAHVGSKVIEMCVRLTLQISKPSFMSSPVTMLLLDFCHLIQRCTSDYILMRAMEIVGGMQATEHSSPTFICTLALVSCSYPTLSQRKMV